MTPIFTFWSFTPMTWLERLCLTSWVAAGHPVRLYSYDEIVDLPEGVELQNASDIIHREQVFQHYSGSWATFSDVFRYHGLRRCLGIWCDADVLLLRNLAGLGKYVLAWGDTNAVCNAVLYLPPDEPFLRQMIEVASARVPVPPHWRLMKKLKQRARGFVGAQKPIAALTRTVIGPPALTYYVRRHAIPVLAREILYPTRAVMSEVLLPFSSSFQLENLFTPETRAVHLWNEMIKDHKATPPPSGSFLARMCDRYEVDFSLYHSRHVQ